MVEYSCSCGAIFELETNSIYPLRCPECLEWDLRRRPLDTAGTADLNTLIQH